MAEGERQRVGGVGGDRTVERELARDRALDLRLLGAAAAGDRELRLGRAVLGDDNAGGGRGEHDDAAHLAEAERALHVAADEALLERERVRSPRRALLDDGAVNVRELPGEGQLERRGAGAVAEMAERAGSTLDDAPPGHRRAGIDS